MLNQQVEKYYCSRLDIFFKFSEWILQSKKQLIHQKKHYYGKL